MKVRISRGERLGAAFLVAALLFGLALPSLVLLMFRLNQAEIVRTQCVERFKPAKENCCQGSCQLKKKLDRAAGEQDNAPMTPRTEAFEMLALSPMAGAIHALPGDPRIFPGLREGTVRGHHPAVEHVPWVG